MKINIFTQPLFCNYGGILQNYALQTVLRSMGHEPLTVNVPARYPSPPVRWKDAVRTLINLKNRLAGSYQYPFLSPYRFSLKEHELSFPQRQFVEKYINKVDCSSPFDVSVYDRYPADAWIVGSDQIWRPWCSPDIKNSFFDFIPARSGCKRIAYATSFGTDKWEISEADTEEIRTLCARFDAISVREDSGVRLCEENLGVKAQHVLDPTMLLAAEQYLSLITERDYPKGKYIASYVLDMDSRKAKIIDSHSRQRELKVEKIGRMHTDRFDTIESWLASLAHAELVITDSFHGTVFSILFGRPFMIMTNNVRGNARIESLLRMLEIKLNPDGIYIPDSTVAERLEKLRAQSLQFLTCSLTK